MKVSTDGRLRHHPWGVETTYPLLKQRGWAAGRAALHRQRASIPLGGASWRGSIFDPLRTETGPHPTRGGALFQTLTTGRNGGEFAAHTRILMPLRAAAPPRLPRTPIPVLTPQPPLASAGRFELDTSGRSLLNPFKMSLVSPRVYWNLVHLHGRDVAAGLRSLLPHADWSFLGDRDRRASGKAAVNAAQAAEEADEKRQRKDKRGERGRAEQAACEAVDSDPAATAGASSSQGEMGCDESEEAPDDESEPHDDESEPHDADGWEERGLQAMLRQREYDFACSCLSRALSLRIEASGGDECAPPLARAWYLHGSALLRRAQAMKLLVSQEEGGAGPGGVDGSRGSALPDGWSEEGSAAVGRRVRRFYALHGACDGTVVAWLPPVPGAGAGGEAGGDDGEVALWRVLHDDGDVEEVEEDELDEALAAHREDRTLAQVRPRIARARRRARTRDLRSGTRRLSYLCRICFEARASAS